MLEASDAPLVSVVVPTHNRASVLPQALASVLAQTYPTWELIVVDDASTDDTPRVVAGFAAADRRATGVRLPINCGHPARPRNIGWLLARGVYIAYLDDDDNAWRPRHLARLVAAAEAQPGAIGAYGGRCNHLPDGTLEDIVHPEHGIDTGDGLHRCDVRDRLPAMWTETDFRCEDVDYWGRLRLAFPGGLVWVPEVLSDYYIHRGNRYSTHWLSFRHYDPGFYRRNAATLDDPARRRALISLVADFAPRRVLDVGCGRGWVVRGLRERGIAAWGVDPSSATEDSLMPGLLCAPPPTGCPSPTAPSTWCCAAMSWPASRSRLSPRRCGSWRASAPKPARFCWRSTAPPQAARGPSPCGRGSGGGGNSPRSGSTSYRAAIRRSAPKDNSPDWIS